ncbi:hypothetical protein ABH935_009173 [Catenulispora sp. GAS73]|uniref:hypothetical protein n=1 Tax=Catenulispora sp. GAS73 TaxID=3156269 RepID=UPI00351172D7
MTARRSPLLKGFKTMLRPKGAPEGAAKYKRTSMWIGHGRRLTKAAGISTITLRCHADTWNVILELMRSFQDWSAPQAIPCPPGAMVEAQLSGPKVAALLFGMRSRFVAFNGFNRAVARRVYIAVAEVVDLVDSASAGSASPAVFLNDIADGSVDGTSAEPD